jgi:hypothetical protein
LSAIAGIATGAVDPVAGAAAGAAGAVGAVLRGAPAQAGTVSTSHSTRTDRGVMAASAARRITNATRAATSSASW